MSNPNNKPALPHNDDGSSENQSNPSSQPGSIPQQHSHPSSIPAQQEGGPPAATHWTGQPLGGSPAQQPNIQAGQMPQHGMGHAPPVAQPHLNPPAMPPVSGSGLPGAPNPQAITGQPFPGTHPGAVPTQQNPTAPMAQGNSPVGMGQPVGAQPAPPADPQNPWGQVQAAPAPQPVMPPSGQGQPGQAYPNLAGNPAGQPPVQEAPAPQGSPPVAGQAPQPGMAPPPPVEAGGVSPMTVVVPPQGNMGQQPIPGRRSAQMLRQQPAGETPAPQQPMGQAVPTHQAGGAQTPSPVHFPVQPNAGQATPTNQGMPSSSGMVRPGVPGPAQNPQSPFLSGSHGAPGQPASAPLGSNPTPHSNPGAPAGAQPNVRPDAPGAARPVTSVPQGGFANPIANKPIGGTNIGASGQARPGGIPPANPTGRPPTPGSQTSLPQSGASAAQPQKPVLGQPRPVSPTAPARSESITKMPPLASGAPAGGSPTPPLGNQPAHTKPIGSAGTSGVPSAAQTPSAKPQQGPAHSQKPPTPAGQGKATHKSETPKPATAGSREKTLEEVAAVAKSLAGKADLKGQQTSSASSSVKKGEEVRSKVSESQKEQFRDTASMELRSWEESKLGNASAKSDAAKPAQPNTPQQQSAVPPKATTQQQDQARQNTSTIGVTASNYADGVGTAIEEPPKKTNKKSKNKILSLGLLVLLVPLALIPMGVLKLPNSWKLPGILGEWFGSDEIEIGAPTSVIDYEPEAPTVPVPESTADTEEAAVPEITMQPEEKTQTVAPVLAVLEGQVIHMDNKNPLADAEVVLTFAHAPDRPVRMKTDAEGTFGLSLEQAAQLQKVEVVAGTATTGLVRNPLMGMRPGKTNKLTLEVSTGAIISGVVSDESGQPISGARVYGWCRPASEMDEGWQSAPDRVAITNAKGTFTLPAMGEDFVLSASAAGYACQQRLSGVLEPGAQIDGVGLTLGPSRIIRGWVMDQSGKPVAGAKVVAVQPGELLVQEQTSHPDTVSAGADTSVTLTNARGEFALHPLAAQEYLVKVQHDDYIAWAEFHDAEEEQNLEVRLTEGRTVRGSVIDPGGRPAADAWVAFFDQSWKTTRSDEEGQFSFTGTSDNDQARLLVLSEGHALFVWDRIPIPGKSAEQWEILLEPEQTLEGRVLDVDGKPVADVLLSIAGERLVAGMGEAGWDGLTWEEELGLHQVRTDSEGRFRFNHLYTGSFDLKVFDPEDPNLFLYVEAESGTEPMEVTLDQEALRLATIRGEVLDLFSETPVPHFAVLMKEDDEVSVIGNNGFFEIKGLEPSEGTLRFLGKGYLPKELPTRSFESGINGMEIYLVPARQLGLRVLNRLGQPVQGKLRFENVAGKSIRAEIGNGLWTNEFVFDNNGEVHLNGLPAGEITGWISVAGQPGEWPLSLDMRKPMEDMREIQLPVEPTPRQVTLNVLVCGMSHNADFPDPVDGPTTRWIERMQASEEVWFIDKPTTVWVKNAQGDMLTEVKLKPLPDGTYQWEVGESTGSGPLPMIPVPVPTVELKIEARVEGYQPTMRRFTRFNSGNTAYVSVFVLP